MSDCPFKLPVQVQEASQRGTIAFAIIDAGGERVLGWNYSQTKADYIAAAINAYAHGASFPSGPAGASLDTNPAGHINSDPTSNIRNDADAGGVRADAADSAARVGADVSASAPGGPSPGPASDCDGGQP